MESASFRLAVELRDRLLAELQQNPNFLAYEHVQAAIVALAKEAEGLPPSEPVVTERNGRQSFKSGSQSETILTATTTYLREKKARAQSAEIFRALTDKGVVIGGRKPRSTLASYLSHSALFDNVRNEGYGLVEWSEQSQTETPNSGTLSGAPKANGSVPLSP